MMKRWTTRFLFASTVIFVVGCGGTAKPPGPDMGGFSDLIVDAADDAVEDKARKSATRESAEHLAQVFDDYAAELWKIRTKMFYLNANYDVTEEAFERYLGELEATHEEAQHEFIEALERMHREMTASEWKAFNKELASRVTAGGEGS